MNYPKEDFKRLQNCTLLSDYYAGYWLLPLVHKSGHVIHILVDKEGNPVTEPNETTQRIRTEITMYGEHTKIIPISIDNHKLLVVKFPDP